MGTSRSGWRATGVGAAVVAGAEASPLEAVLLAPAGVSSAASALDRSNEPVSATGQRFDVARTGSGVSQRLANLVDGRVQAVVEVDERVGGPELLLQLFARDHLARPLQQQSQHLKGLLLQAQLDAALAQFSRAEVQLEDSEARDSGCDFAARRRSVAGRSGVVGLGPSTLRLLRISGTSDARVRTAAQTQHRIPLRATIAACPSPLPTTIPSTAATRSTRRKLPDCC